MFKDYFGVVASTIVMLIVTSCMTIISLFCSGTPFTLVSFFTGWANAFLINMLAAIILPVNDWGYAFAVKLCKAKPGSMKFTLLNAFVLNGVFATVITLGATAISVGLTSGFFKAWISLYPILIACGYVLTLIASSIAQPIAARVVQDTGK